MTEKVKDDPSVREIYSNRVASLTADGAVVAITLAHRRNVPATLGTKGADTVVVNNRICLPEATVIHLYDMFGKVLEQIAAKKAEVAAASKRAKN